MRGDSRGNVEPLSGDRGGAKEALDRVSIPQEILDRIAETISPRSSLIISDVKQDGAAWNASRTIGRTVRANGQQSAPLHATA
jgi:hypothetical protein